MPIFTVCYAANLSSRLYPNIFFCISLVMLLSYLLFFVHHLRVLLYRSNLMIIIFYEMYLTMTGCFSLNQLDWTHIRLTLRRFEHCVRLLNQWGSQLCSFAVSIVYVHVRNSDIFSEIASINIISNFISFIHFRFCVPV